MKIVKIKGGLGNQMFQYCFAKLLKQLTHEEVKIDMSSYESSINDIIRQPRLLKYNISLEIASSSEIKAERLFLTKNVPLKIGDKIRVILERVLNDHYYFESNRAYRNPQKLLKYSYYDGYWQSWRYLTDIEKEIREEFCANYQLHTDTICLRENMKKQDSVFIGIRRGDYLTESSHYGSFAEAYYNAAISEIERKITNPVFYIFSNDIPWVKQNLSFGNNKVIYREKENIIDDFEELQLMASCQHAIIGNSTFHWWGAWLNDNPNKIVIAPYNWFFDNKPIDIVPPTWLRMSEDGVLK